MTTDPVRPQEPAGRGRTPRSAATIYDVAKLAGVAPSTVSRALGKPGRITITTRLKVEAAAAELHYRLNPMARSLPTGRTSTLAMLVADFTNPMFFEVVRGAERAAADRGYTMILSESQESADREARTADRVIPSVDGLILVTTRLRDEQIRELSDRKPLVVINREVTGVDSIVPTLEPGIGEALDLLAAQGHRSMAFLSGPQRAWMSRARWDVLFDGATRRGMRIVEIPSSAPTIEGGRDALKRVFASGVTAVVAYNDLIAIGLLQGVQGSGGQVPRDLSIIGFDDIFGSDFTSPPLTTVMTPLGLMGERAVEVLLEGEGGVAAGEGARPPNSKLVLRGSVGPALLG